MRGNIDFDDFNLMNHNLLYVTITILNFFFKCGGPPKFLVEGIHNHPSNVFLVRKLKASPRENKYGIYCDFSIQNLKNMPVLI